MILSPNFLINFILIKRRVYLYQNREKKTKLVLILCEDTFIWKKSVHFLIVRQSLPYVQKEFFWSIWAVEPVVISMWAQGGGAPIVAVHIGGGQVPLTILYCPCFSKCIDLASKVFCNAKIDFALLHGYWDILNCWLCYISI